MKILIFAVLVLLCFHASLGLGKMLPEPNICEVDLRNLTANARIFITDFKGLHVKAHNIVAKIAEICADSFKTEFIYLSGDFSTDLKDAKAKVYSFVAGYAEEAALLLKYFKSVEASCDELWNMARAFKRSYDLTLLPNIPAKRCETKLNSLRNELSTLMDGIKTKRDAAVAYIKQMKGFLSQLNELVKRFASTNDLAVGKDAGSKSDYCKFRIVVNQFFAEFNKIHWTGQLEFVNLQFLCDEVTAIISTLYLKYICY